MALVLVIVVIGAIVGGGEETTPAGQADQEQQEEQPVEEQEQPAEEQEPPAEEEPAAEEEPVEEVEQEPAAEEDEEAPAAIGEPVTIDEVQWVIDGAEFTNQLQDDFGQVETGNFIVVDFTFSNNGSEAVNLRADVLTLLDNENRQNSPDTDRLFFVPAERNIIFEQINPGVSQEGTVIYTVAEGASDFTLQIESLGFFSSDTASVDLGF